MDKAQLAILATELEQPAYAELVKAQDYPALAAMLNAQPSVDNPVKQSAVPMRLTLHMILVAIAQVDMTAISAMVQAYGPILDRIDNALQANDRTATQDYFLIVSSGLNDSAKGAVAALLAQTEPDPNWQATVAGDSLATELGIAGVADMDVQLALHPELWSGE